MKKLYVGFDLHSNNSHLGIIDQNDTRVYHKRLPNMLDVILAELEPYKKNIVSIVVESTYNWYWLVDGLMENFYEVHLANPAAIKQYTGLKHVDDKHDAFWLAHMERLGILPTGYIYPKELRPVRDLLRKRGHLVRLRTSLINSLQGIISRNSGSNLSGNKIKRIKTDHVKPLLEGQEDLELSGKVSKQTIDYLGSQITNIESVVLAKAKQQQFYEKLLTIPGVGKILSLIITFETGSISRFPNVGNYASYARKVPSNWKSNDKRKGKGNTKNGNKYLAWAFSEAAEFGRRYDDNVKAFFNRKSSRTSVAIAYSALGHKLARAAYYIMRDNVEFDSKKLFT
jgi:transposase